MRVNIWRFMAAVIAAAAAGAGSSCKSDNGIDPVAAIDIALSQQAVTVRQNASEAITVTLTRTGGATGDVDIAVTGAPTGVTVTVAPPSIGAGSTSSVITIAAGPGAATGPATLTVHATAPGVDGQTETVALTVTAAVGGSTTWEYCSAADLPIWFAVQDGTGAWTRIAPSGTKFEFDVAAGRGGVAYVTTTDFPTASATRSADELWGEIAAARPRRSRAVGVAASAASSLIPRFDLFIVYGTQPELAGLGLEQCVPGKRVNGGVANLALNQFAEITLGSAHDYADALEPTFQLTRVDGCPLDLVASRNIVDPSMVPEIVDRIIIRRGLNPADNSTLPVLDFTGLEAFAPAVANLTVGNLGTDKAYVLSSIVTAGAPRGATISIISQSSTGPFNYFGVPAANQLAGDLHFVAAFVFSEGAEFRGTGLYFKDPTDRTSTLGSQLPMPNVEAVSTSPYVRLRATGSLTTAYNRYVRVLFSQPGRSATIEASAAYLSNATTYDLAIPDLTGVAGWVADWGLKRGVQPTVWFVTGFGFTGTGVSRPAPVEGATFQFAERIGSIMP